MFMLGQEVVAHIMKLFNFNMFKNLLQWITWIHCKTTQLFSKFIVEVDDNLNGKKITYLSTILDPFISTELV